ncbi:hypothetical protein IWW55_001962 [Coemansia sp. RSA 2706]|nr:hypothetical protein IWW55_001962 [Coemansia sp. RSA 2706]
MLTGPHSQALESNDAASDEERCINDGTVGGQQPDSQVEDQAVDDSAKPLYDGVDNDRIAEYANTKRSLDALLGCDRVANMAPFVDSTKCSEELQVKFRQWYQLKDQGANFNEALMRNKTFRNPNIYRWLVDHLQLEEAGTNLPSDGRFDPAQLRKDFSVKGLADDQERRAREYAARKAAPASAAKASGSVRSMQFQSGGFEKLQTPMPPSRPPTASTQSHPDNGRSFEEAVQRAKLIAQHLARPNKQ